jgi:catechol 2,3-dioxygenase-like lactoylglutathione lyase family enzyme
MLAALPAALMAPSTAAAAPVAEADRVPLDLRRTTLVVDDMERSLAFYRDALGLQVIYDNWVLTPRDAPSPEEAEIARRLVFLRANDDFIGVLGLLQYVKPDREPVELEDRAFHPGTTVLVFNHQESRQAFERARQVEGAKALSEPSEVTYPNYAGDGVIRVLVSVLQDPDGVAVEINQLLEELH